MAQVFTHARTSQERVQRTVGWGLVVGAVGLTALLGLALNMGRAGYVVALVAAGAAGASGLLFWWASELYLLAARERRVLATLRAGLPADCCLLTDLELPGPSGRPVRIWAAVVGPAGVAVIQPCSAAGRIHAAGAVWMVRQGHRCRLIPSPAEAGRRAAQALKAATGMRQLPFWPVVVLTDHEGVYHPAPAAAMVVGAPHLAAAVGRLLCR